MADLPSIANRMNDIEISANAPVTESTNRKVGSNINALLDALGIADGGTGAGGVTADLQTALGLIEGHTADLVFDLAATGGHVGNTSFTIGTFAMTKYVNQVFTFETRPQIFGDPGQAYSFTSNANDFSGRYTLASNASGSFQTMDAPAFGHITLASGGLGGDLRIPTPGMGYGQFGSTIGGAPGFIQTATGVRTRSRMLTYGIPTLVPGGFTDMVELDYRDASSIALTISGGGADLEFPFRVYRSYRLAAMSDIF